MQFDLDLKLWTLLWWYNTNADDKTLILMDEFESADFLDRWVVAVQKNMPVIIPDVEKLSYPPDEEEKLYNRLCVKSVIAISLAPRPVGLLVVRNPKRYIHETFFLRVLAHVVLNCYREQQSIDRLHAACAPAALKSSNDVYVKLFGELEIRTNHGILREADFNSPLISKLLTYLLISNKRAVTPMDFAQKFWPDDCDNPTKRLKGPMYRLRQTLSTISDEQIVVCSAHGYQLNPKLHIISDIRRFDGYIAAADKAVSVISRVDYLKKAVELYKGTLLASASDEPWLTQTAMSYYISYVNTVNKLLKYLEAQESYDLLHKYAAMAIQVAPENSQPYSYLVRSLKAQGMYNVAEHELEAAKTHLTFDEYVALSDWLKKP